MMTLLPESAFHLKRQFMSTCEPLLRDTLNFPMSGPQWMDSNFTSQQSGKSDVQERFSNGRTHDHYVTSVFVFCPNGTIPIAFFNVPGTVDDSQIAHWGKIYNKLD
jgi:hypothetical protein